MEIILNGKPHPLGREMTIQELVDSLGFSGKRIAVERNAEIVPRSRHAATPPPAEAPGRCPYHQGGRCRAREGRPLACRTYFCDRRTESALAEAHEHFLARLRELEREAGYPRAYARFTGLVEARTAGRASEDEA